MSQEKRDWSFISPERFVAYLTEADRLVAIAGTAGISVFASAIAGAAFIRNALATMGGKAEWWINLITSKEANPLAQYMFKTTPDVVGECGHLIDHGGTSRLCRACQRAKDLREGDERAAEAERERAKRS